jgi:hypothetical protein
MTFGLKNAGATYQRAMNYIFHELIGKIVEIYIDDVVIKSLNHDSHLENIEKNKLRVAKYYNKKVKVRQFAEGDLVWKALLPIGTKYSAFGKWSPNWEGPFRVVRCVPGNAYMLKTLLGEEFSAAINGRYLKKYYPSIEVDR